MNPWVVLLPALVMLLPILAIGVTLRLSQRLRRDRRRSPLTTRLHYQPGEQLRQRIAVLDEKINDDLLMVVMAPMVLFAVWALLRIDWATMS